MTTITSCIALASDLTRADVARFGGKGANLGELMHAGLKVPAAFVVSVDGYERFCEATGSHTRIADALRDLNVDSAADLTSASDRLRALIENTPVPPDLAAEIEHAYETLCTEMSSPTLAVAVRSSATAEDTAQHSFAGMFESFLNVRGAEAVLQRVRSCWASTFRARVLFYRIKQGLAAEMPVAVVVQAMINGDRAGVMFTVDPATRDPNRIVVEAAWGLGESVVLGEVTPDRYVLDKRSAAVIEATPGVKDALVAPIDRDQGTMRVDLTNDPRRRARVLTDKDLIALGDLARRVEAHYGSPQDIEFVIENDQLYVTQSRPITTLATIPLQSQPSDDAGSGGSPGPMVRGLGASPGRATGRVRVLAATAQGSLLQDREILVAHQTSPDWVPLMRRAAALVTDAGGMTSHAAIVSRELGIPCVVGSGNATKQLGDGMLVTVDGEHGTVVAAQPMAAGATHGPSVSAAPGEPPGSEPEQLTKPAAPKPAPSRIVSGTRLYVNLAEPARAAEVASMDVDGVGLLRAEFMLLSALDNTHPRQLLAEGRGEAVVTHLADNLRVFGRAFSPRPVIYRAMDFRTNEFRGLRGGSGYEPVEQNPMIGYRGCYRYLKEPDLFALELRALAAVRREWPNVHLMIPFVRTAWEFRECKRLIDDSALRGDRSLLLWVMAEVPSVVHWLGEYVRGGIAGVSIGSNDLTQLVLGVDRDNEALAPLFDERDGAVLHAIESIIAGCRRYGITSSICGQAPSVHPDYVDNLVRWGIDSVSVNADVTAQTRVNLAAAEQRLLLEEARRPETTT
jgi:pyruvate,water dikinase